jgi:hypothetical protein
MVLPIMLTDDMDYGKYVGYGLWSFLVVVGGGIDSHQLGVGANSKYIEGSASATSPNSRLAIRTTAIYAQ